MGREHRGELWGMANMFKENAEGGVAAHDIIQDGRADALYRIQECDPRLLGALCRVPARRFLGTSDGAVSMHAQMRPLHVQDFAESQKIQPTVDGRWGSEIAQCHACKPGKLEDGHI